MNNKVLGQSEETLKMYTIEGKETACLLSLKYLFTLVALESLGCGLLQGVKYGVG